MKALFNSAKGHQLNSNMDVLYVNAGGLSKFKVNHIQPLLENAMVVMSILIFVWVSIQNIAVC